MERNKKGKEKLFRKSRKTERSPVKKDLASEEINWKEMLMEIIKMRKKMSKMTEEVKEGFKEQGRWMKIGNKKKIRKRIEKC